MKIELSKGDRRAALEFTSGELDVQKRDELIERLFMFFGHGNLSATDKRELAENHIQLSYEESAQQALESSSDDGNDEDSPEHWRTGIKIKNGRPCYQTFYRCHNCNKTGKHFIPEGAPFVTCYHCNFNLKVEPAHPDGLPNRDEFGNYYIAKKLG